MRFLQCDVMCDFIWRNLVSTKLNEIALFFNIWSDLSTMVMWCGILYDFYDLIWCDSLNNKEVYVFFYDNMLWCDIISFDMMVWFDFINIICWYVILWFLMIIEWSNDSRYQMSSYDITYCANIITWSTRNDKLCDDLISHYLQFLLTSSSTKWFYYL